jgi:hypothetical protein
MEPRLVQHPRPSKPAEILVSGRGAGRPPPGRARAARTDAAKFILDEHAPLQIARAGFSIDKPTQIDVYAAKRGDRAGSTMPGSTPTPRKVGLRYCGPIPPAGRKNRVDHRTLALEPGRYGVTMVSDDSHDPDEWNAPPPFDPSFYGVTLRAHNAEDAARVKLFAYDPTPAGKAIVDLTRVGDSESRQAGFTLTKPMDVRIYALGEEPAIG